MTTYIQTAILTDEQLSSILSEPKNRLRDSALLVQLIRSYQELCLENEEIANRTKEDIQDMADRADSELKSELAKLCLKHNILGGPYA